MTAIRLACIVGARPNFMKMAPLLNALSQYPHVRTTLVHTGQHYDANLSDVFFEELGMKCPDVHLEAGSASHGVQTARVLERFEAVLQEAAAEGRPFDRVVVVGDVNSTMAATLAAAKLGVPVAHVEAGLRSFDRTMPEEINRVVTDALADILLVSEPAGLENLRREGVAEEKVFLVGNVMIDTLRRLLPQARARGGLQRYGLTPGGYGVVTLHRPSNVDDPQTLRRLLDVLIEVSGRLPLVFPVHPRTQARIEKFGLADRFGQAPKMVRLPPVGYLDFLEFTSQARVIVTDSGGLQEEATALNIPCLTMRRNTERPITVQQGTSTLVGNDPELLRTQLAKVLEGRYESRPCPELWDGHAAQRIANILVGRVDGKERIPG